MPVRRGKLESIGVEKEVLDNHLLEPLPVIVHDEELKPREGDEGFPTPEQYKQRAIDRALKNHIPFTNDYATTEEIVKKVIRVACPECGKLLDIKDTWNDGYGPFATRSFTYQCKDCPRIVEVTIPLQAIKVF